MNWSVDQVSQGAFTFEEVQYDSRYLLEHQVHEWLCKLLRKDDSSDSEEESQYITCFSVSKWFFEVLYVFLSLCVLLYVQNIII